MKEEAFPIVLFFYNENMKNSPLSHFWSHMNLNIYYNHIHIFLKHLVFNMTFCQVKHHLGDTQFITTFSAASHTFF